MAAIKPLRQPIVYPTMMRHMARARQARAGDPPPADAWLVDRCRRRPGRRAWAFTTN